MPRKTFKPEERLRLYNKLRVLPGLRQPRLHHPGEIEQ